ncbi:MAG TPA: DUF1302 domain-containing protein [Acidiferrobacteraceae bacterium]|nr:DUF1302 domain-containing protein [Acidiferrobacteraceae bacterium]
MNKDHQYRLAQVVPVKRLTTIAVAAVLLSPLTSQAIQFTSGELTGSFDTTVSTGIGWRIENRDPGLIGIANGGTALSVNGDDGNLNYDKGVFSSSLTISHELELNYRNFGAFVRGYYFYDFENEDGDRARSPLSSAAKERVGSDFRLLDAYVSANLDVQGKPLTIRVGNQVVSWGESTFIPNGINIINPVDVARLRSPGAALKEAFLPVPMVWGSLGVSENVTIEGFYQAKWEEIIIDPAGSYFSTNDIASRGGNTVYLGFGSVPDTLPVGSGVGGPGGVAIPRAADRDPSNSGQYGVALRWILPQLNDTELGFYYINYHSRLPLISATSGTLTGLFGGDYASSANYFIEYPENIKLFGASFNMDLGNTGISFQGEIAHRRDQPLQVDDVELLFTALSPISAALGGLSQLGSVGFGTEIPGYKRFNVTQVQATMTKLFGPMLGADQVVLLAEGAFTKVHGMPSRNELRFDGPGTSTSGTDIATLGGAQPATQRGGFADDFSMGYRVLARLDFNNAIGAVNLSPRIAFAHDVVGTTPLPLGNFVEDRKALSIGIGADYQNTWSGSLNYTRYFGGGNFNLIHDRDFISLNVRWSK